MKSIITVSFIALIIMGCSSLTGPGQNDDRAPREYEVHTTKQWSDLESTLGRTLERTNNLNRFEMAEVRAR